MRRYLLASIGLVIAANTGHAQTPPQDDAGALQRSLEDKALRIPENNLAAALSARTTERSDRARIVRRQPDWAAVRADLERTRADDAERDTSGGNDPASTETGLPGPPPPGLRAFASNNLPRVAPDEISIVTIPVLAPAHPDVRQKIKLYGQENTYTATGDINQDANLSISGACDRVIGGAPTLVNIRKRLSEGPPHLAGLRANYHISRNEYGVDLSFSKFDCGYVITIECSDPDNDERCVEDRYITMIARSMMLINPERAGSPQ